MSNIVTIDASFRSSSGEAPRAFQAAQERVETDEQQ